MGDPATVRHPTLHTVLVMYNVRMNPDTGHWLLRRAAEEHGLEFVFSKGGATIGSVRFEIVTQSFVSDVVAHGLVATTGPTTLVVADRVTADARVVLQRAKRSFCDARGSLFLTAKNMLVAVDFEPSSNVERNRLAHPLDGAAFDVALWILHAGPQGTRAISRAINRPSSTVNDVVTKLRNESLLYDGTHPLLPELFELCVEEWKRRVAYRAVIPGVVVEAPPRRAGCNFGDLAVTGWASAGVTAQLAWRTAGMTGLRTTTTFFVPNEESIHRAKALPNLFIPSRLGGKDQQTELIVSPVPWLCAHRVATAHGVTIPPIAIAMELAADAARGREILDSFNPEGYLRVW
jgi:hypothetical protein